MSHQLILSDNYITDDYFRLLNLFLSHKKKVLSSIKTSIKLELRNKKSLRRFYDKLLSSSTISDTLLSYIALSYCLLKQYIFSHLPWILGVGVNINYLAFFVYHFLTLFRGVLSAKMMFDWLPAQNWDRSATFIRFIRRMSLLWIKPFGHYIPSSIVWMMVLSLVPMLVPFLAKFCYYSQLANFPTSYSFVEMTELVIELNLITIKKRNLIFTICLRILQNCGTKISRLLDKDLFKIYMSY